MEGSAPLHVSLFAIVSEIVTIYLLALFSEANMLHIPLLCSSIWALVLNFLVILTIVYPSGGGKQKVGTPIEVFQDIRVANAVLD